MKGKEVELEWSRNAGEVEMQASLLYAKKKKTSRWLAEDEQNCFSYCFSLVHSDTYLTRDPANL